MKQLYRGYLDSFKGLSTEVWWLALITLINRAGTMVVPFLSLYLTEDLNFSLIHVGWIMTAFGLGSLTGSWLGGKLTDTFGAYKIMVGSLMISGFMFLGIQYVKDFYWLCASIFLLITVADTFRPAMFVALGAYSKPENSTRSVTLIRLAINLGFSAGPALGGLIITQIGYGGLFWVDGLTCILAAFLLFNILNPKKAPVKPEVTVENPKSAYRDSNYWVFILSVMLFGIVFMQYFSTIPLYYNNAHMLSELEIGLLFGGNGLLIFIFEMPLVKWLENTKRSKSFLMIIGVGMIGISFLILNMTMWAGVLVIAMLLITFGEMIAFPFSNAYAMERSKLGNKGEYMAFYMMAFSFAHIFSHNAGMRSVDKIGFEGTWFIVTALSLVSLLLLALLGQKTKREELS